MMHIVYRDDHRSEAETLLDLGRSVRHAADCVDCMRGISEFATVARMAHALKFADFADQNPGETFLCLVEERTEQQIARLLY